MGMGQTLMDNFVMYYHQQNQYPLSFVEPSNPNRGTLYGHVFMCTPEQLVDLDEKYQNTEWFYRARHWVRWVLKSERSKSGATKYETMCHAYLGFHRPWKDKIESKELRLLKRSTPLDTGRSFYVFNKNDDATPIL